MSVHKCACANRLECLCHHVSVAESVQSTVYAHVALSPMSFAFVRVSRDDTVAVLWLVQTYSYERLRTGVVTGSHAGSGMRACVPWVFCTVALLLDAVQFVLLSSLRVDVHGSESRPFVPGAFL